MRGGSLRRVLLRHAHHAMAAAVRGAVRARPHAACVPPVAAAAQQPPRVLWAGHREPAHRLPALLQQRHRCVEPGWRHP